MRSHESFRNAGINWNAVDRGEEPFRAPFEAQEFVLPTPLPNDYPRYTDYEVMAPLTPKVQAAFRSNLILHCIIIDMKGIDFLIYFAKSVYRLLL